MIYKKKSRVLCPKKLVPSCDIDDDRAVLEAIPVFFLFCFSLVNKRRPLFCIFKDDVRKDVLLHELYCERTLFKKNYL